MTKILVISDDGLPSGFGRISSEINLRLVKRGYEVLAASLTYDGLLPAQYDGFPLPYHVAALNGREWVGATAGIINAWQPDIIMVTQDFPYAVAIRNAPLDWSKYGFIIITPVDGVPIHPDWLNTMRQADAGLTISEFGVNAFRQAGIPVGLCRPGVNLDKFYPLSDDKRLEIRQKLGIDRDAFVLGGAFMNQGRKLTLTVVKSFMDFAIDKPNARLLLDMDLKSPAGWDVEAACQQFGWDRTKIISRADCLQRGIFELRERYNVMDAHMVIAAREGWGLPIVEAMACGVVSMGQDYCAYTEQLRDNRGVLISSMDYFLPSTWGNALDRLPNYREATVKLQWLHDNPNERLAMAKRGMAWARTLTWDSAADNVIAGIEKTMAKRKSIIAMPVTAITQPPMPTQPDGVKPSEESKSLALIEQVVL